MKNYTVHQITISRETIDLLNREGWGVIKTDERAKSYGIKMDLSVFGAGGFEKKFFEYFKVVAQVIAENLEDVFALTNGQIRSGEVKCEGKMGSVSVGDIIQDGDEYFMVEDFGFVKIEI